MKKIMKKNQVIITSLAILIAVAGYLNFADVDLGFQDEETSADSILEELDYDITDETALLEENMADETGNSAEDSGTPGEAVLTGSSGFAAQAKVSREQIRSQNKADLQEIISNQDIGDEQKQTAINTMVEMTELTEKEAAAELLLAAKGFENVIVNLTGETADVVVPDEDLEDSRRAQIEDIVKRKTGVAAEYIVITPLSEGGEEETSAAGYYAAADQTEGNYLEENYPEESYLGENYPEENYSGENYSEDYLEENYADENYPEEDYLAGDGLTEEDYDSQEEIAASADYYEDTYEDYEIDTEGIYD